MTSNALNLLSAYNSESDSEDEVPGPRVSVKRCLRDEDEKSSKSSKQSHGFKLPVPAIFKQNDNNDSKAQNELHGGRVRTFAHERGNWSTYVFISYEHNDIMEDLIGEIILKCKPLIALQPSTDLHISLTRTVILRHHWIDSFMQTITQKINPVTWFIILFDKLKVYCNEERTRTFISLQIKSGHDSLVSIVQILDNCLKEYNLPEFYKDPSFHMSLAWCVGDYENTLNNILSELNDIVNEYMSTHPQFYWYIHVKNLFCKTGNKLFNFKLSPTNVQL